MGRPIKEGLDYAPVSVNIFDDDKICFVEARFGESGELFVIKILLKILANGYYINWGDDEAQLFATRVLRDKTRHSFAKDVVQELLKRDFFDKGMFESFKILTSKGIQRRWMIGKKNKGSIKPEYCLISDEDEFRTAKPPDKMSFGPRNVQNSVGLAVNNPTRKESKEKKRKESKYLNARELENFDSEVSDQPPYDKILCEYNRICDGRFDAPVAIMDGLAPSRIHRLWKEFPNVKHFCDAFEGAVAGTFSEWSFSSILKPENFQKLKNYKRNAKPSTKSTGFENAGIDIEALAFDGTEDVNF